MKKTTVLLSILLILLIAVPQVMAKRVGFRSFTQMQAQNGASYADGDSAIIVTLQDDATYPSETHSCTLDADSGAVESLPTVVSFTSNANDKRWLCERIDGMASGTTAGGDLTGTYPDPTIAVNSVNDTHMDWGVGADQVSAVDVPIADGGSIITGIEVETALQENRGLINTITANVAAHSDTTATGTELETLTDTSDASGLHNHTTANLNDTTATGTELTELTDGSVTTEHDHSRVSASDGTPNNAIDCDADGNCAASGDLAVTGTITSSGADQRVSGTNSYIDFNDAGSGSIRMGGVDNTNDEALDYDFETVANQVDVSSATGVAKISYPDGWFLGIGDVTPDSVMDAFYTDVASSVFQLSRFDITMAPTANVTGGKTGMALNMLWDPTAIDITMSGDVYGTNSSITLQPPNLANNDTAFTGIVRGAFFDFSIKDDRGNPSVTFAVDDYRGIEVKTPAGGVQGAVTLTDWYGFYVDASPSPTIFSGSYTFTNLYGMYFVSPDQDAAQDAVNKFGLYFESGYTTGAVVLSDGTDGIYLNGVSSPTLKLNDDGTNGAITVNAGLDVVGIPTGTTANGALGGGEAVVGAVCMSNSNEIYIDTDGSCAD